VAWAACSEATSPSKTNAIGVLVPEPQPMLDNEDYGFLVCIIYCDGQLGSRALPSSHGASRSQRRNERSQCGVCTPLDHSAAAPLSDCAPPRRRLW